MIDADGSTDPAGDPALRRGLGRAPTTPRAAGSSPAAAATTSAAPAAGNLSSTPCECAFRHSLLGPLLRLQRVPARRARRLRAAAGTLTQAARRLGRRIRDRDPDQHPGGRSLHGTSARSPSFEAERIYGESNLRTFRTASGCWHHHARAVHPLGRRPAQTVDNARPVVVDLPDRTMRASRSEAV